MRRRDVVVGIMVGWIGTSSTSQAAVEVVALVLGGPQGVNVGVVGNRACIEDASMRAHGDGVFHRIDTAAEIVEMVREVASRVQAHVHVPFKVECVNLLPANGTSVGSGEADEGAHGGGARG